MTARRKYTGPEVWSDPDVVPPDSVYLSTPVTGMEIAKIDLPELIARLQKFVPQPTLEQEQKQWIRDTRKYLRECGFDPPKRKAKAESLEAQIEHNAREADEVVGRIDSLLAKRKAKAKHEDFERQSAMVLATQRRPGTKRKKGATRG